MNLRGRREREKRGKATEGARHNRRKGTGHRGSNHHRRRVQKQVKWKWILERPQVKQMSLCHPVREKASPGDANCLFRQDMVSVPKDQLTLKELTYRQHWIGNKFNSNSSHTSEGRASASPQGARDYREDKVLVHKMLDRQHGYHYSVSISLISKPAYPISEMRLIYFSVRYRARQRRGHANISRVHILRHLVPVQHMCHRLSLPCDSHSICSK